MQRYIPVNDRPDMAWPESGIEFVVPRAGWQGFTATPLAVGDGLVLDFMASLSRLLMAQGQAWPDLVALGFWLRPAALMAHVAAYQDRSPLGLTFHLVPSNVPTLGVFSWLMALLAGNSAIVRLSSRQDAVQHQLLALCAALLDEPKWQAIADRVRFIRYPHDEQSTVAFSAACQLRVIWGGDATVNTIRAIALPARARELVFPDRRSLALIDCAAWLALDAENRQRQQAALAQDISQFNQQACASPTSLVWLGAMPAAERSALLAALAQPFAREPAYGMARLVHGQLAMAQGCALQVESHDSLALLQGVMRADGVQVGGGVLLERHYAGLAQWLAAGDQIQTCVCVGVAPEQVLAVARQYPATRLDRLVRPGQALAFDWFWDGQDLLAAMTRQTRCS